MAEECSKSRSDVECPSLRGRSASMIVSAMAGTSFARLVREGADESKDEGLGLGIIGF